MESRPMFSHSTNVILNAPVTGRKRRRQRPLLDWSFGCFLFALVSTLIGLELFDELGDACFLCPEDIGWPLVIFAYAIPGLAFGSAIWAVMWLTRLSRGSKLGQFRPIVVVLFVAVAMLAASLQYLFAIPAAKETLNVNPELTKSIVKVSTNVPPYTHPDEPQGESYGTGIVIDAERGWIVTSAHVAMRVSSDISIQFSADPNAQSYPARKLYVDPYLDLAILEVAQGGSRPQAQPASLECEGKSSQDVVVMGYAGEQRAKLMIVKGTRIASKVKSGKTWFRALADYQHGMSGGPTLDGHSGRVLGINTLATTGYVDYEVGSTIPARYVCHVIDLLKNGVDPTPPHIPIAFYDNLSSEGQLVVVETDRSASKLTLIEGDIVLGVEGTQETVSSESDLMDILRGANYPINLRIRRGGTEQLVPVSFSRMESEPRRTLLYVSGFVIGGSKPSNRFPDRRKPALMIRLENPSDTADPEPNNFDIYTTYIILSVDGKFFEDMTSIHGYLAEAQSRNLKTVFKLREWGFSESTPYRYQRLAIVPDGLKIIQ
jgi:S1-C subfamily serine protease